ncbi:MAG: hypothetical protein LBS21_10625 [Clostridiales bacterium]|jgi:hypothetical protein|nr:hypothetical protein [Clostridiales bacterium]
MNRKNTKRIVLSVIILAGLIMAIVVISHPFFKSPEKIMNEVIKLTPMGTHIDDVANLVNSKVIIKRLKKGERGPIISYDSGYVSPGDTVPGWPVIEGARSVVGYKSVKVSYDTFAGMYFSIYWGFDKEGKLIDIFVYKTWDMIQIGGVRETVTDAAKYAGNIASTV